MDLGSMRLSSAEMMGAYPMQMLPAIPNDRVLYVGNLSPDVNDPAILTFFQQCSAPLSVRLMRDMYTGESRRFGFVTFNSEEEARHAQELLNHEKLDGFEMRISVKRTPSEFKAQANVFIKNIALEVGGRGLQKLCGQFGNVLSCIIRSDEKGNSLGYGFVQFETEEEARKAIEGLNEREFEGKQLVVQQFQPQRTRTSFLGNNVYLKNFPASWSKERIEQLLREHAGVFGSIVSMGVFASVHPTSKAQSYYGFIAFDKAESATSTINALHGRNPYEVFGGEASAEEASASLYAVLAVPRRVHKENLEKKAVLEQSPTNIFIRSLKPDTQKEDLIRIFSKFGEVFSASVQPMKAVEGIPSMSYGFVNFSLPQAAQSAVFEGKRDPQVLALLALPPSRDRNFIAFFQSKVTRNAYLKMRRNLVRNAMPPFVPPNVVLPFMMPFMPQQQQYAPSRQQNLPYAVPPRPIPPPVKLLPPVPITPAIPSYTPEWLKKHRKEFFELPTDKQKKILGNLVFSRISKSGLASATDLPKVAGMLSDVEILEYEEIVDLLENEEALVDRVTEAVDIIRESSKTNKGS